MHCVTNPYLICQLTCRGTQVRSFDSAFPNYLRILQVGFVALLLTLPIVVYCLAGMNPKPKAAIRASKRIIAGKFVSLMEPNSTIKLLPVAPRLSPLSPSPMVLQVPIVHSPTDPRCAVQSIDLQVALKQKPTKAKKNQEDVNRCASRNPAQMISVHQINREVLEEKNAALNAEIQAFERTGLKIEDVQKFVEMLHVYNQLKDSAQDIFGRLAHVKSCMVRDIYRDFGLSVGD